MKTQILRILFISCFFYINGFTQHTNIMISDSLSDFEPEEPSIIINPKNTEHIVAGANLNWYFYSTDGGSTWSGDYISSSYGVWGDPCIIVDTAGNYYYFHLSNPTSPYEEDWLDRIVCQKLNTPDGTWSDGTYMGLNGNKDQDKEWAVVDPLTNNIYVTWTQFDKYGSTNPYDSTVILFSRSLDGGQTWSTAKRINKIAGDCIDSDNTVEGAVPAVGPNGEIYVAWAGPEGIVFDKSLDYGETWLTEDVFVSDIPGGWDFNIPGIMRCNGLPVTACDISNSPYCGNIYINWTDQRNGTDDTDVWLSKSTDGGNTWSLPRRVNNDAPGNHQFFTWLAIDQTNGYLYFVFYDRRNYNDANTDVYMAVSKDGGETFYNFKISESPFYPYSSIFFGDYTNISAHNNVIRPIWTRLDHEKLSIWTAIIDTSALGIDNTTFQPFSLDQNTPNPFAESTYISFSVHHPSYKTLKIFDIFGRKISTIIDNKLFATGKYVMSFDSSQYNIESGIYYFSLLSNDKNIIRKMVYLK